MAIVRHKQPPLRRFMMYWVDHARQAFSSLGSCGATRSPR